jgi:hypothetical protein
MQVAAKVILYTLNDAANVLAVWGNICKREVSLRFVYQVIIQVVK